MEVSGVQCNNWMMETAEGFETRVNGLQTANTRISSQMTKNSEKTKERNENGSWKYKPFLYLERTGETEA